VIASSPPAVVLVTRPWNALYFQSIRLGIGILKATLEVTVWVHSDLFSASHIPHKPWWLL